MPPTDQPSRASHMERRSAFGESVVRIASLNEAERTIEFVASTEAVDSYRTIIRQNWDLSRFEANPVVLYNHNPNCPLGTAEVRVEDKRLIAKVRFATGDEEIDEVWNLVKQLVIRGMSVGFRPLSRKVETINGAEVMVFDKSELYELSVTTQPSNAEALARNYQESTMPTEEEKRAIVEEATKAGAVITRAAHDAAISALKSSLTESEQRATKLETTSKQQEERLAKLEDERLVRKVDELVGKKYEPAQREDYLKVIRMSESVFDGLVKNMPDLGLLGERKITGAGDESSRGKGGDVALKKLNHLAQERAARTGESPAVALMAVQKENPDLVEASSN